MPNISFPDEELIQEDDKMAVEIEKRRIETEKKIYFALKNILRKPIANLTVDDKKFLKARKSYLTKAELQEYDEVLNERVEGSPEPKLEDLTRTQLEEKALALGIAEPEKLANKAAIIEAINAAQG